MNRTIARILILACLILRFSFMPLLYAQALITPGNKTIKYAFIRPCYNTYKLTMYDSLGKVIRDLVTIDMITIDTVKGLLTRTQHNSFPGGFVLLDSTVADLKTLSPKRMRMVTTPDFRQMELTFGEKSVHAIVHNNKEVTDTIHTMDAGYFDSNLFQYLVGLLPYKEGFSALINLYTFEKNGMDPHKVEYVGKDMLPGKTGLSNLVKVTRSNNSIEYGWYDMLTGVCQRIVIQLSSGILVIEKI